MDYVSINEGRTMEPDCGGALVMQDGPATPFVVTVPDPLACMPAAQRRFGGRAHEHPVYAGPIASPPPITGLSGITFRKATVESRPNTQFVMFHGKQSSFSSFSPKTGRLVSGLGPHEHAWRKELDVDPFWVDFEMQGLTVHLGTDGDQDDNDDDDARGYRADWIGVDWNGVVHAGEIKADLSYFWDPDYAAKLSAVEDALSKIEIVFHRATGKAMRANCRRMLNIDQAYGDAFTTVTLAQAEAINECLLSERGPVLLGHLEEAIGGTQSGARAIVHAALCRRMLSYDLDGFVNGDTPVDTVRTPDVIVDIRSIDSRVDL